MRKVPSTGDIEVKTLVVGIILYQLVDPVVIGIEQRIVSLFCMINFVLAIRKGSFRISGQYRLISHLHIRDIIGEFKITRIG
ncbi:hypothetical protein D3C72_1855580 [compost metagenome]